MTNEQLPITNYPSQYQSNETDKAPLCSPYLITSSIKAAIQGVHACLMQYNSIRYPRSTL
jgi:hypothetical protein